MTLPVPIKSSHFAQFLMNLSVLAIWVPVYRFIYIGKIHRYWYSKKQYSKKMLSRSFYLTPWEILTLTGQKRTTETTNLTCTLNFLITYFVKKILHSWLIFQHGRRGEVEKYIIALRFNNQHMAIADGRWISYKMTILLLNGAVVAEQSSELTLMA
jgi:hypothetical protein